MKTLEFPLAKITLFFVIGLLLGYAFEPSLGIIVVLLIISCAALIATYSSTKTVIFFSSLVFSASILLGLAAHGFHSVKNISNHYSHFTKDTSKNYILEISIREKLKASTFSTRYFGIIQSVDGKKCEGKILINLGKDSSKTELSVGNRILVTSKIIQHKKPNNPHQFDYGKYLMQKSVSAQIYLSKSEVQISSSLDKNLWFYATIFREKIIKRLQKNGFREQELQVANALILGQQQEIDKNILQDYQFAGAVHILSVSGLHVGYIMLFLNVILAFLPCRTFYNWLKFIIIILTLWTFAFVAGLSPSVVRSATMFSFIAGGICLTRENNIFHILVVSLFFILLVVPSFIFDVGFQLSYASLFFILWLQPILSKLYNPTNFITRNLWSIFTVSLAAQIGAFPLSIYYFHQFPGLFFITNLIILPFLGIIMILGIVVMIGAYFNIVASFLILILQQSIYALNWVIAKIASFENFVLTEIPLTKTLLFCLYLVTVSWILWFEKSSIKKLLFALACTLLLQISYLQNQINVEKNAELIVFHLNKKSLFIERNGTSTRLHTPIKNNKNIADNPSVKSYLVANFIEKTTTTNLKNVLFYHDKKIMVLDSFALMPDEVKTDLLIITQSPKINLDRFITKHQPKIIIADGSNYKTYIKQWEKTCSQRKIPFHATAVKGFYKIQ